MRNRFANVVDAVMLACLVCGVFVPVMALDFGSVPFSDERKRRDAQEEATRIQESVQLLDMAAREGEPQAMVLPGMISDVGFPVKRDLDRAIGWYVKAADKQYGKAWLPLAFAYAEMGNDVQAGFWFEKAAGLYRETNADDVLVMVFGAGYLADYIGKDQFAQRQEINRKRLMWLEGLAASGDPVACSMMATVYREGLGVKKDVRRGDLWCKKAVTTNREGMVVERFCY